MMNIGFLNLCNIYKKTFQGSTSLLKERSAVVLVITWYPHTTLHNVIMSFISLPHGNLARMVVYTYTYKNWISIILSHCSFLKYLR